MKIIVASHNPVKLNAVKLGFAEMFPGQTAEVVASEVDSGVPDQPMSEEETLQGAHNRVDKISTAKVGADYWVGIEGGVEKYSDELAVFAWVIIKSKTGKYGRGRTNTFFLPHKVSELVKQGKELGDASDQIFSQKNSKQKQGSIGLLTDGKMDRTTSIMHAVMLALIPFKNPNLY